MKHGFANPQLTVPSETKISSNGVKTVECHSKLHAPKVEKDSYSNLIDWSDNEKILIGLHDSIYVHNPLTNDSQKLHTFSQGDRSQVLKNIRWKSAENASSPNN